jgi:hypothetical protein
MQPLLYVVEEVSTELRGGIAALTAFASCEPDVPGV